MFFPWILLEPLQWKVLETRTGLGSSAILHKPTLRHAECCAGWWGKSLLPRHPSTSFPWKRWGAKTREQALGRLQRGSCGALTEPSVDSRWGGPSSLALLCRLAPETASTLFLTPGCTCQQQLVTFQKLLCFYIAGFNFNSLTCPPFFFIKN